MASRSTGEGIKGSLVLRKRKGWEEEEGGSSLRLVSLFLARQGCFGGSLDNEKLDKICWGGTSGFSKLNPAIPIENESKSTVVWWGYVDVEFKGRIIR